MRTFSVLLVATLLIAASAQASFTVATFASPSSGSTNPLFLVDWDLNAVTGGWADGLGNLSLEFVWPNVGTFNDVWFEMSDLTITSQPIANEYGYTSGGVISFYETGTVANPLLVITFADGYVNKFGLGSDNAVFTGSQISGTLSEEQFSFSFAAVQDLKKTNGFEAFSATAAFNSSAIPEPATLAIFGLGSLLAVGLRKRA